jgi:exonuclease III
VQGLFWNCRGVKKKGLVPFVRDLIREKDLDFLCFQETMMQDFPDSCLR